MSARRALSCPFVRALRWLLLVSCVAALAVACSQRAVTRFPHQLHLAGIACGSPGMPACLSCGSCHAVESRDTAEPLPGAAKCTRCHHDDPRDVSRVLSTRVERRYGNIAFDHDRHLALKGLEGRCVTCHAGVVDGQRASLPPMAQCFGCHEHEEQWTRGQCAPCHTAGDLRRTMPQTFLRHEGDFLQHHGTLAVQQKPLCQACHSQADCDSCHDATQDLSVERRRPEAVTRNFVHRGDFLSVHALEAQSQPARCARCHTPESCDSCHLARGVSGGLIEGRNPHPPGWVSGSASARSLHGQAARRDILLCASCHDQGPATNCIRCHKVGGYGGNPHPAGWKSTRSESAQMCRYCHE